MMTERDLAAEIIAASDEGLIQWLHASLDRYGVRRELACIWGLIHPIRAHLDRDTFQPSPDGRRLWCCPVRIAADPDVEGWQDVIRFAPMIDAVAFDPQDPECWGLRLGLADWLGAVEPQDYLPDPAIVHRHPLAWLRSRCRGICLLTRDQRRAQSVLMGFRRILAADVEHGRELRRICATPLPTPEIFVPDPAEARAA